MVEAEHTCMAIRGVNKPGTSTVTTAVRGCYRNDPHARAEVLTLLGRR
jgi:GTP cyclohydrolase I